MRNYRCVPIAFLLFVCMFMCGAALLLTSQEVVLVYKDIGKPVYMNEAPDNAGLYQDLFQEALGRIGFRLEIERYPKVRTYELLESGAADLYPGGIFNLERSEFLLFLPVGLYRDESYIALTSANIPEMKSPQDMNEHQLSWLVELGSTQPKQAAEFGVPFHSIKDASIEKAILLIRAGRPFCFRVIREELDYYMQDKGLSDLAEIGMRAHSDCFPERHSPLYFGFSRKSSYYREEPNPSFDPDLPISAGNFPVRAVPGSLPDLLQTAFKQLQHEGFTARLEVQYEVDH